MTAEGTGKGSPGGGESWRKSAVSCKSPRRRDGCGVRDKDRRSSERGGRAASDKGDLADVRVDVFSSLDAARRTPFLFFPINALTFIETRQGCEFLFGNSFLKIPFTYRTMHPLEVCDSMVFSTSADVNYFCIVIQPSSRLDLGSGFQKSWPCIYRRRGFLSGHFLPGLPLGPWSGHAGHRARPFLYPSFPVSLEATKFFLFFFPLKSYEATW